jgi:hypothetical protein
MKATLCKPLTILLTIYILFYLTAFRTRLFFLLCIYKVRLLKLLYKPRLHNVALKKDSRLSQIHKKHLTDLLFFLSSVPGPAQFS